MPLRRLRQGYIRASDVFQGAGNYQIKVDSDRYRYLVRARDSNQTYQTPVARRQTRALRTNLPSLYEQPTFTDLARLIRRKHRFNEQQRQIATNVLRDLEEKKNKNNFIKFTLEDGETQYLPLNDKTITSLTGVLTSGYFGQENAGAYGSGSDSVNEILSQGIAKVEYGSLGIRNLFKSGSFFRYLNMTNINLEKYQIISESSDIKLLDEHCLIYALQQFNVNQELLNRVKTTFEAGSFFPKKNIKQVCDIIKKNINLTWFDKNNKKRIEKFSKEHDETFEIALYQDHYFINENTIYSSYSSLHYNEVKDEKDFHNIQRKDGKKYKRTNLYKVDSITLIRNLFMSSHFDKDNHIIKSHNKYQRHKDKIETLALIEDEQELYEYKPRNNEKKTIIFYADIETDVSDGAHKPILMRFTKTGDKLNHGYTYERKETDEDKTLYDRFMNSLARQSKGYEKVIVYFHNLKYDYSVLKKLIFHMGAPCEKDGQLYNVKFMFRKRQFEFRDSYKLAPMSLASFQKSFGLPKDLTKKEAIAYEYYTIYNMEDQRAYVDEYEQFLSEDNKKIFKKNLEDNYEFRYRKDETGRYIFNPNLYYKYYLEYDTYILMKGLEKFEEIIDKIVSELNKKYKTNHSINLFDYLTISSLTHAIMGAFGAYEDVYQMCGNLREFCGNFVTGGRVQVNEKYKKKIINKKIGDYDGVSLYPSAIRRLCDEMGLPKGKAEPIDSKDKKVLDTYDYYMVKIRITKINKQQQLPMVSYKDENGSLKYINEIKESIITYVDMITLNDWIEFQGIEYEIISGVYYNNGFNKNMGDLIHHLFINRLKHKKAGNQAMQLILKLMMNSSYGKTITKKTMTKKVIINDDKKDQYIANYFNTIKEWKPLTNTQWEVKMDSVDMSHNMAQVGSFILSYSKRIMNEVFDTANTHKCPLYYTDTDSIHCNYDDVKTIEDKFRIKYNRELTGKQLGQFHIDFDLDGAKSEIYATQSIFLGKKCYIDKLESTDAKGNIINGYHFRMKGVNTQGIKHCAKKFFNDDIFEVYKHLAKGNEQDFVLNPEGGRPSFEYISEGVRTRDAGDFVRSLKF